MKLKRIIFYLVIVISVFFIYKISFNNDINYVSLGDGLANGINSYGYTSYGYYDYICDYYSGEGRLNYCINEFSNKNYRIRDIYNDINLNKSINTNNGYVNIKSALRESNLVTLSIGYNDFISDVDVDSNDFAFSKQIIDEILFDFDNLLSLVKKYAKNKIIVIGVYNPYINNNNKFFDVLLRYYNSQYESICKKNNVYYVDIYYNLSNNSKYLSNFSNRYPNILGYREIFNNIKKYL